MANSDKNILITPSVGLSTNPTIKFNGANNTPTTLRVLDDGTVSFEGTAGQLFSISDGLTGSIFSVNDISGIPSIEVLDTGLVKLNQYGGSTVFGSSAAIQNASSVNAKVSISTTSATTPGLIIKGVSSQSANLQEWQNSSGTVLAYINSLGFASVPAGLYVTGGGGQATALLSVAGASNVSSIISRGVASQTANLQEWQNSAGTVLARIQSDGALVSDYITSGIYLTSLGKLRAGSASNYGGQLEVTTTAAGNIGAVIRGAASQTANLQEWQDSTGTWLASINSNGRLFLPRAEGIHFVGSPTALRARIYSDNANRLIFETANSGYMSLEPTGALFISSAPDSSKLIIRASTSQTVDLQQWQDGYSNVLAKVGSSGQFLISPSNSSVTALTVKAATSQTANLQEWQNSNGTAITKIGPNGGIDSTVQISGRSAVTAGTDNYLSASLNVIPLNASIVGAVIRGYASQTADLQQWQNSSGTVLTRIDQNGNMYFAARVFAGGWYAGDYNLFSRANAGNEVATVVRGNTSQTADLQQWQNSSGTVLSNITADGWFETNNGNGIRFYGPSRTAWSTLANNLGNLGFNYAFTVGNSGLGANLGTLTSYALSASTIGLVVRGAASQTANLQEWQNSAGSMVANVNFNGDILAGGSYYTNNAYFGGGAPYMNATVNIRSQQDSYVGVAIRARSSQTGNLQEWQNSSGTVLAKIAADGSTTFASPIVGFVGNSGSYSSTAVSGYNIIHLSQGMFFINSQTGGDYNLATNSYYNSGWKYFESAGSTLLNFGNGRFDFNTASSGTAGNAITYTSKMIIANSGTVTINGFGAAAQGLIIKGATSQTANLQEWQDSSGTILGGMQANGQLFGTQIKTKNAYIFIGEQNSGGSTIYTRQTATPSAPGTNAANLYFRDGTNAGTLKLVVRAGSSGAETTILDNIPQS